MGGDEQGKSFTVKRAEPQMGWTGFSGLRFISRGRQAENLASRAFMRRWRQATMQSRTEYNSLFM